MGKRHLERFFFFFNRSCASADGLHPRTQQLVGARESTSKTFLQRGVFKSTDKIQIHAAQQYAGTSLSILLGPKSRQEVFC